MSEDDEWVKTLKIPGMALPALRDLRIQFIALIEFDIMLGPVMFINELRSGSSYIKKLRQYETLSEVYAGLARSPQHTVSTLEEDVSVFRYDVDDEVDLTSVFLISCLPDSNLEPVRELGQKALFNSKADAELIGRELSKTLREKLTFEKKVGRSDKQSFLIYTDDERLQKELDYQHIRGIAIVDLDTKNVDVRNLARWIEGKEIIPKAFIQFFDNQIDSVVENSSTSLLYQDIPFLATKVPNKEVYIILQVNKNELEALLEIKDWFNPFGQVLGNELRVASAAEIRIALSLFDEAKSRNTPHEYLMTYATMLLRNEKIKPNIGDGFDEEFQPPEFISMDQWVRIFQLDGQKTIAQLVKQWKIDPIDLVTILEWARARNLVVFFQD
ncbi:MAG: hypothetical protein ACW99A_07985 [Candidatus Kariarchaeaceae archaeon]|jgi:hypothetical protein